MMPSVYICENLPAIVFAQMILAGRSPIKLENEEEK